MHSLSWGRLLTPPRCLKQLIGSGLNFSFLQHKSEFENKSSKTVYKEHFIWIKFGVGFNSHGTSSFKHFGWNCKLNIEPAFYQIIFLPEEVQDCLYIFLIWSTMFTSSRKAGYISCSIFLVLFEWLWFCFSNSATKTIMQKKSIICEKALWNPSTKLYP